MALLFLDGKVTLHAGDCLDVLATLPENSVDSCACDPPYHLTSIVKRFANTSAEKEKFAANNDHKGYRRLSAGFMGKKWDGGDVAFRPETWAAVYRVLKPGAHLIAFGGTRTYHRMACAIEDAGFEIRDQLQWLYGSGFPKSHDVSKGIDRAAGAEREVVGEWNMPGRGKRSEEQKYGLTNDVGVITAPATDAARQWQGWGTALKPACEPIVLARKPLSEGTVAANVLKWGTGALNIDGCRVGIEGGTAKLEPAKRESVNAYGDGLNGGGVRQLDAGRWPANVIHDGSEEVVGAFPETDPSNIGKPRGAASGNGWGMTATGAEYDDAGSAARFFYTAKADSDDRLGSKHPTVKPVDLMQYLVRLVTPKGGTVLDCFAGTGTTGEAAWREGFRAILIEREAEYQNDIRRRMDLALAGPAERGRESIKARGLVEDAGPLFGCAEGGGKGPHKYGHSKSKFFVAAGPSVQSGSSGE